MFESRGEITPPCGLPVSGWEDSRFHRLPATSPVPRPAAGAPRDALLDTRSYATGRKVTRAEMAAVLCQRNGFHGDWNYTIHPRDPSDLSGQA